MAKVTPVRKKAVRKAVSRPSRPSSSPKNAGTGFLGRSALAEVLYGPSGVGKTSFAAHFPGAGFIMDPQEQGILDLAEFNQAPGPVFTETVGDFESLLRLNADIAAGEYAIQTAVFDSLTGFEKLCFHHHCDEHFDGDWSSKGFYSYQQGPKNAAKTDWPRFLDSLEDIRRAGINVILIAHSQVKNYSNPEGADYERFTPYLDKETWAQTHRWARSVLFYNYHVELDKKGLKTKAKQVEQRFIYTAWSPAFDAKTRYGLPPIIDAGDSGSEAYAAYVEAFQKIAG